MPKRDREEELVIARAFGEHVREVRLERGMNQDQLAEAAELHAPFISNLERGYRVPSLPTVLRVARGLAIAPCKLVNELQRYTARGQSERS